MLELKRSWRNIGSQIHHVRSMMHIAVPEMAHNNTSAPRHQVSTSSAGGAPIVKAAHMENSG